MNKCVQDIKLNCKTKQQFIKYCAEYRAFSLQSLADLMGIHRSTLYKLIADFVLDDEEKLKLTRKKLGIVATASTFAETMNLAEENVDVFVFNGVRFYIDFTTKALVYKESRGHYKPVSELKKDDGKDCFYFNNHKGKRITISKARFMYCYFNGLYTSPKGKYIEAKDGIWWKKDHLIESDKSKKDRAKQYEKFINKAKGLHDKGGLVRREFLEYVDNFFDNL